ncbi:MAG: 4-hydroxy-tetrahydrodipicolinate reductase [Muribaculaceae bacterium]|nr:4-hydroxy-tetrahydrodipicolinate reductase [Muribaculaceae bacterium]
MKIAIIGYGKMGHTIERIAKEIGHEIVCIIDADNQEDFNSDAFRRADVAIEFTTPSTAFDNYLKAFKQGVTVVSGSTGWLSRLEEIKEICANGDASFFYSSNYSIGMNIFFELNKYLAKMMNRFSQYNVNIKEIHHIHKLDHPSGTAITLAEGIINNLRRKTSWTEDDKAQSEEILIKHEREGEVAGTHIVEYKSSVDRIVIEHEAYSREGLALGAIIAAEWMQGKKGYHTMDEMMNLDKK